MNISTNRRQILKNLILCTGSIIFCSLLPGQVFGEENNLLRKFQWRVPKAHSDTVSGALQFEGQISMEKDTKGVPLVFIYTGIVLLPYLAKAILALRREIVYGGVIIDTRGDKIVIDTDKSLASGIIIVVTSSGTQLYEREEITAPKDLLPALVNAD